MAGADEFEEIEVYPLRSFRLITLEGQPTVRVIQLSSGTEGSQKVVSFAMGEPHLRLMLAAIQKELESLKPS